MPYRAGPASAQRRAHTPASPRLAASWIVIAALAAAGWAITFLLVLNMGSGPGTMGLTLPPFLGMWMAMMAAMMLPSVAPVVVLWARLIGSVAARPIRVARMGIFLSGYLMAWAAYGAVAFAVLTGTGRLLGVSPTAARWLGAAIFVGAGVYQMTPWKDWCRRHCRSPIGALVRYVRFNGHTRDLRVEIHHGATCVGCCWGLMMVLIPVGVMNVPAMVALAVVIFTEKVWRHGRPFGLAIGVLLLAAGVATIWFPSMLPGLAK